MKLLPFTREQRIAALAIALGAALLVAYWVALVQPLLRSTMELDRAVRLETQRLQQSQRLIAQQPQLQQEFDRLSNSMKLLRGAMPGEQELSAVIEQISGMATRAGVKIQTIFPQRSLESLKVVAGLQEGKTPRSRLFKEIPIQIDALAGFHQLGAFLTRVEHGRQPVQLKSLRISGNTKEPRRQTIEMVLVAYFATADGKDAKDAKDPAASGMAAGMTR